MRCPACHFDDTRVNDSRLVNEGMAIRRRRECAKCGFRFSTYEEVEILNLTVIKRDGRHEPYSKEKLERGLHKAFEKRPITHDDFKRLVNKIERDIQLAGKEEIKSSEIGEIIMRNLKRKDQVAYIRFASVYRSFKDVQSFQQELKKLLSNKIVPERKKKQRTHSSTGGH
ncbi:MAG: transcriptional repressor NrdR [Candidatus Kerfeldbacteria bacterium]|nr:transcriptional repressor NrdR [Candidatus Kerfeldbacteria bacterium]